MLLIFQDIFLLEQIMRISRTNKVSANNIGFFGQGYWKNETSYFLCDIKLTNIIISFIK